MTKSMQKRHSETARCLGHRSALYYAESWEKVGRYEIAQFYRACLAKIEKFSLWFKQQCMD